MKNASGETALILACRNGHQVSVISLLDAKADPDVTAHNGRTALIEAAHAGHAEIVKSLLKKGAKYRIADENGTTALMAAVLKKQSRIVSLLAELEQDFLEEVDQEGRTALTLAHLTGMLTHHTETELAKSGKKLPQSVKVNERD
jgi:ankyrin repeat protein